MENSKRAIIKHLDTVTRLFLRSGDFVSQLKKSWCWIISKKRNFSGNNQIQELYINIRSKKSCWSISNIQSFGLCFGNYGTVIIVLIKIVLG